jgi:predicted glutamine amidotransferase
MARTRAPWALLLLASLALRSGAQDEHACRLYGVIGPAPDPVTLTDQLLSGTNAFVKLAEANHDGWGLAYFAPSLLPLGLGRPQILRGGPPANAKFDPRFGEAVGELITLHATCAVAHLRAASSGHSDAPDPHPFIRDAITLAHNGSLYVNVLLGLLTADDPAWLEEHLPDYDNPYIDSELYFLYVQKLRQTGVVRPDGVRSHRTGDAIAAAALRLYDAGGVVSSANCLVAVRDTLFALRFDTSNHASYKLRYKTIAGARVVASQPVGTDTTGWSVIPPKTLAVFPMGAAPSFTSVYPPTTAWLVVDETKIDDDLVPPSAGDGDAALDAGETAELRMVLHNVGGQTASTIIARLSCPDSFAVMTDTVAAYPNLLPGGIALPLDPFVLRARPDCPNRHPLLCTLTVTAGLGGSPQTWTRPIGLGVSAPDLRFQSADARNDAGGPLMPGDTGSLRLWLENAGGENATSLTARLESASPWLELLANEAGTDTLAPSEVDSLTPVYRLRLSPQCPSPETIALTAACDAAWGIAERIDFDLAVGGFHENVEGGEGLWTHAPGIPGWVDQWHVSTLMNHTPGGTRCWKCGAVEPGGTYARDMDAVLTAPPVPLTIHTELRFWHYIHADLSTGHFGKALDGGLVEASINGGPWTLLYPTTGYDYVIDTGYPPGPFPPGTPVFSGWWSWRQAVYELDGYTGTVQFRFRFGSDGERGAEGWNIDDIEVLGSTTSSDAPDQAEAPLLPSLRVGGPSPFRETTAILYDVARPGEVELSILDLEGRVVRRLARGAAAAGRHRIVWDGRDADGRAVPSGLYFYRLTSREDGFEEVRRVIRVR